MRYIRIKTRPPRTLLRYGLACTLLLGVSPSGWALMSFKSPAPYLYMAMLSQTPFSADAVTTVTGGKALYAEREHIQVSHQKMRRELQGVADPRHMSVYISDFAHRDDYGTYALSPSLKVYWAIERPTVDGEPLTEARIDSVMSRYRWHDSEWEQLGSERINGEKAIGYRYTGELNDTSDTQLKAWFTADEHVLAQISVTDAGGNTATTKLSNIETGPQPDAAFAIGDDYAEVSTRAYMGWLIMVMQSGDASDTSLQGEAAADAMRAAGKGQ